jgi:hypothetical protein
VGLGRADQAKLGRGQGAAGYSRPPQQLAAADSLILVHDAIPFRYCLPLPIL